MTADRHKLNCKCHEVVAPPQARRLRTMRGSQREFAGPHAEERPNIPAAAQKSDGGGGRRSICTRIV